MKTKLQFLAVLVGAALSPVVLSQRAFAQETDYEFMPAHGWGGLSETGDPDASARLAEGFEGLTAEPGKNTTIEPVDGAGGFDNVAPRLGVEEGPGGLDWDPSPSYRTRYSGGTDYAAGSGKRIQGNNWFVRIPYLVLYSTTLFARFEANAYRVYTLSGGVYWGTLGNSNSKITETGSAGSRVWKLHDTRGKIYTFEEASPASGRMTKLEGLGGVQTTISYSTNITILQKPSSTSGNEVRRFTYYLNGAQTRLDKIDIEEKVSGSWTLYRKIDFTYHEDISGAVEGSSGDLIGIQEDTLLSPASTWLTRKWTMKYFTGTYNSSTNPGYPYQVKAVLGPQSVHDFEVANPSTVIYTQTASQLASYVDRQYEYASDKRVRQIDFKSSCGCGGGEGVYGYAWDVNGTTPTDQNTWYHRVTITLPSANGSSRIIDYNKYGQLLNRVAQEVAGNSSSRRWIETWAHDTTGRLTDSYSVKACTSYTDSSHTVTTNTTAGMRYQFAYDSNSALATVKLRDPSNGNWNYQEKKAFSMITSGDRRRFVKTSDTVYPTETTTDTGGIATSWSYTYPSGDALAVKKRTTTLPTIATSENGSNSAVTLSDYFETDALHTWAKDGDGFVHYTGYDSQRGTVTKTVRNINTASLPSGVPSPPSGEGFDTTSGLNIVTDFTYDSMRRLTKATGPAFNAWTGSGVASVQTTKRIWYTKLSGGEFVTVEYPHVDTGFFQAPLTLTVRNYENHILTSAQGSLGSAYRDTTFSDDLDSTQSTLSAAFHGTVVKRSDFTYDGSKVTKEEVWSVADNSSAAKYTTEHSYDAAGRRLTTKTSNGATTPSITRIITRWSYDVLYRTKTKKVGTVDGGGSDNMTLVEERFYDDEEDSSTSVGDGNLTRVSQHTAVSDTPRTTDYTYDYRRRLTDVYEPLSVHDVRTYTNRNQVSIEQKYTASTLLRQAEHVYDAWGREFRTKEYRVPLTDSDSDTYYDYAKVEHWWNGRNLEVKTLSQGKVFQKTQYDGAGRVTNRAVSYDGAESAYGDADDLSGDTVMEETVYSLDAAGAAELVRFYQRRHNGSGTGDLTVGTSGNGRAQYTATWYDKIHRPIYFANYGTNGGTDLTSRPTGSPPTSSSSSSLVTQNGYYLRGDSWMDHQATPQSHTLSYATVETIDPQGISQVVQSDDAGHEVSRIENAIDLDASNSLSNDRTTQRTYDSSGRLLDITAKLGGYNSSTSQYIDLTTEYVYGVSRGSNHSLVSSNDLVYTIEYPDPTTGAPSTSAVDEEFFGYNAQGEVVWKKDQAGTEHTYTIDDRGRLTLDDVTTFGSTSIDQAIKKISRTYDALDRSVLVSSLDSSSVVKNEVKYEYGPFSTVTNFWQEWTGAVTGSSPKVSYTYQYPTNGTTGLRRASTTYKSGRVINEEYTGTTNDTLSRVSGRADSVDGTIFSDSFLGLGRLVERSFGGTYIVRTLVGTDSANQDNYLGLDRFGRIDELQLKNTFNSSLLNDYLYSYNYDSQATVREDTVGHVGTSYEFDETWDYDGLKRLVEHKRGAYSGGSMSPVRLDENWTLDRSGNTTSFAVSQGGSPVTTTETFNGSNELSSRNADYTYPAYDNTGNMTQKGGTSGYVQTYDAWNRLVNVKNNSVTVVTYKYNGLGRVIERPTGIQLYYYYGAEDQILEDWSVYYSIVYNWYLWGTQYIDDLVVFSDNAASYKYVSQDANFNVTTQFDTSNSVLKRFAYECYGLPKQLSADWATWQSIADDLPAFTGRWYQRDHARTYYRDRTMDPGLMFWVQRDPIGIDADKKSFLNWYEYVAGDPLNNIDSSGHSGGIIKGAGDAIVDLWHAATEAIKEALDPFYGQNMMAFRPPVDPCAGRALDDYNYPQCCSVATCLAQADTDVYACQAACFVSCAPAAYFGLYSECVGICSSACWGARAVVQGLCNMCQNL